MLVVVVCGPNVLVAVVRGPNVEGCIAVGASIAIVGAELTAVVGAEAEAAAAAAALLIWAEFSWRPARTKAIRSSYTEWPIKKTLKEMKFCTSKLCPE